MFIDGIGIKGYRSFGGDAQKIGPFSKINLFVGQNNAGKSNILRLIHEKHALLFEDAKGRDSIKGLTPADYPLGTWDGKIEVLFGIKKDGERYKKIKDFKQRIPSDQFAAVVERNFDAFIHSIDEDGVIWSSYQALKNNPTLSQSNETIAESLDSMSLDDYILQRIWAAITRQTGGHRGHWRDETINAFSVHIDPSYRPPSTVMIPAVREVKIGSNLTESDFSGFSINHRLAQLQNPSAGPERDGKLRRFRAIIEFLRSVTGSSNASIEITYGYEEIIVHMDGRDLPLESLGTGIHEVVILAAAATVITNQVVCIEEPELHLHPILQRKLLKYLHEKTSNQYFITTHSAHLLDTKEASIFHVQLVDGYSKVDLVTTPTQKTIVCADLGYRASDLLQANAIIWVEGPSDRIYLRHWIKELDPNLIEGVHYSIMFYGGRLLSHLTAHDPEIDDFISLRRLNRYIAILIDNDRENPTDDLNETKKRIQDEFDEGHGFAWVTEGREIENYFNGDEMEAVVKSVHPSASHLVGKGLLEQQSHYINKDGQKREMDKVKVAHRVVEIAAMKPGLDFQSRIKQMVEFIQHANNE